ncbi:MAG TPA: ferredoxin [Methanomassiliicoccales archaeon]|jgi:ferredoxin
MPKVTVNHETCISCGLCFNDNCPDVFEEGADGSSQLRVAFRKETLYQGEIPDSMKACAQKAEEDCPVSAITVK